VLIFGIHVNVAAVLAGVALENLSVLFQFIAVELDDFGGSIIGVVVDNHEFEAEGFREKAEVDLVLVLVVRLKARTRIERQSSLPRVGIATNVQIPHRTADVGMLVLAAVWLAILGRETRDCHRGGACYREKRTGYD